MEYRKLWEMLDRIYPYLLVFVMVAIDRYRSRRDGRYAALQEIKEYNSNFYSKKASENRILWLLVFAVLLGPISYYYRFEVGYFSYPSNNIFFGIVVLVVSTAATVWIGQRIYFKTRTAISRISYFFHSIAAVVSISLIFGSIQFLIYSNDKDSYVIDADVLAVQIKQDINRFEERIQDHRTLASSATGLRHIFSDSLAYSIHPFEGSKNGRGFVFTDRADGFEYKVTGQDIDIFVLAPWGPPFGPASMDEVISVHIWSNEIHLEHYFKKTNILTQFTREPAKFDTRLLVQFCDSVITGENKIATFLESKKTLAKDGYVTWDIFGINAIMASFLSNPGYNKAVKPLAIIIASLHVLIAVCLILPNVIPITTFYRHEDAKD